MADSVIALSNQIVFSQCNSDFCLAQGREGGMYDSVSGTEANLSFTNNPQLMARGEDYGRQVRYMHVPVASSFCLASSARCTQNTYIPYNNVLYANWRYRDQDGRYV